MGQKNDPGPAVIAALSQLHARTALRVGRMEVRSLEGNAQVVGANTDATRYKAPAVRFHPTIQKMVRFRFKGKPTANEKCLALRRTDTRLISAMTPERWQTIEGIFQTACNLEPSRRTAYLEETCAEDESLRREIEALLNSYDKGDNFIDEPPSRLAAELCANGEPPGMSPVGCTIGHYHLIELLGRGGMGEVYLASDLKADRKAALKLLPLRFTGDAERLNRFKQEARAVVALNHPNILTIYEIGEEDATYYIVSELIEGETLRQRLLRQRVELHEAIDVAIQVASALAAAHKVGIVHRDIKPENVMLRHDGYAKVLDFGIAKLAEQAAPATVADAKELALLLETTFGSILGTVRYMSPEQARGEPVDERTDIWSLGVVLYEMVAGCTPFFGEAPKDTITSILTAEPAPLRDYKPEVPAELQQIISKVLRKEREQRYQSANEMLEALKSLRRRLEFATELERSREARPAWQRWMLTPTSLLLFVALAFVLSLFWLRSKSRESTAGPPAQAQPSVAPKRIAVLPFKPLVKGDNDQYLEMGMADSLIAKMSNSRQIIVPSLTSVRKYAGLEQDPLAAGRELQVDSVLEGKVQKLDDRIKVTARLLRVPEGSSLWAGTFDEKFADIFTVQDTICQKVAEALALQLGGEEKRHLSKRYTDNVGAYQFYLTGRYHRDKIILPEIRKSIGFYQQAIELDPNYALAYVGLAEAYRALPITSDVPPKEAFPQAKAAVTKALAIDESLAEAHASLAITHFWFDWDWAGAEREAKRAIDLNPNSGLAHYAYGHLLCQLGRHEEAIAEGARARELEPVSLTFNSAEGAFLYFAGRLDDANTRLQKALDLDPSFWHAHLHLGKVRMQQGKYAEAFAEFSKAREFSQGNSLSISTIGYASALAGDAAKARVVLDELKSLSKQHYIPPCNVAVVYNGLGERDEAFAWLEKAYEQHDVGLTFLKVDPQWDSLRSDPRFVALLKRIGLAQAATKAGAKKIAILPFEPLVKGGNDQYLEMGMADSLIAKLSNGREIIVPSLSSVRRYAGLEQDPLAAGRELQVDSVLEGKVQKSDDRIRVTARLLSVPEGSSLWAGTFDEKFADIFTVQDTICQKVAEALALQLGGEEKKRSVKRYTDNVKAYQLYLTGRYHRDKVILPEIRKSIGLFQQALELDPNYALAYVGLAFAYRGLPIQSDVPPKEAFPQAKAAATKALAIDESLAEAHASLAMIHLWFDWDWAGAEREARRAIDLNPNSAHAHYAYAHLLSQLGRHEEASPEWARARELEPISIAINAPLGALLYYAGRLDDAKTKLQEVLDLDPNSWLAHLYLGRVYLQQDKYAEAIAEFSKAREFNKELSEPIAMIGYASALGGDAAKARAVLAELKSLSKQHYIPPYNIAIIYNGLGQRDEAFAWLEKAYEQHDVYLSFLKVNPQWDSFRSDPRFVALLMRIGLAQAATKAGAKKIAVLPFQPLVKGGRDEYLEMGMADSLIAKLSNSREITVPSLTSVRKYAGLEQDALAAGRELQVDSVLEGKVQKSDDRIKVTARLLRVPDRSSLWAGTFDEKFADIFTVQDTICQRVAEALALQLGGEEKRHLSKRYTDNVEAYQLYLTGRYHWGKVILPEIRKSIGFFQQAIELDPNYALAYVGLAEAYRILPITSDVPPKEAFPLAKAAATKALAIDESLAEAHASLAITHLWFDWDWAGAEREAKRAIDLNPNYAWAHYAYALLLCQLGRHQEAIAEGARLRELEPVSVISNSMLGAFLYYAGRADDANTRLQETLDLDPNFWHAHFYLGKVYLQQGKYAEAIAEFSKARESNKELSKPIAMIGYAWAVAGDAAKARAVLDELKSLSEQRYISPCSVAVVYSGLGQRDEAFAWLAKAYEQHDVNLTFLKVDPEWDSFRSDPRFTELLKRMNFPP